MSTGRIGYGASVTFNSVALGQSVDIKGPAIKIPSVKITNNDSTNSAQEKIPGLIDGGQVTITFIKYHTNTNALYGVLRTQATLVITYGDTHSWTCSSAFLTSLETGAPLEDAETIDAVFEVSGKPVYA